MNKALLSVVWLETSGGNFGLTKEQEKEKFFSGSHVERRIDAISTVALPRTSSISKFHLVLIDQNKKQL